MRNVILQFDVHSKFRLDPPKLVPDNAVPYSDVVVLVSILTNTLMMTLSHFDGNVNMSCTTISRCPENLEIMSEGWVLALELAEVILKRFTRWTRCACNMYVTCTGGVRDVYA